MRVSEISRETRETKIKLKLNVDGNGEQNIDTKVGFFDHMLTLFASHGMFDLDVNCEGDVHVDAHHTVEDIGICLGKAFAEAVGEKRGINRYGNMLLPMHLPVFLCGLICGWQYGGAVGLILPLFPKNMQICPITYQGAVLDHRLPGYLTAFHLKLR